MSDAYFFFGGLALLAVAWGVLRIARAQGNNRGARKVSALDPRFRRYRPPQVAGKRCVHCSNTFVIASDSTECAQCDGLLHADECMREHLALAHKPAGPGYR
jgi:hypothetical protein